MLKVAMAKARKATMRDQKSLRISRAIRRITIQAPIRLIAVVSSALGQPNRDATV